MFSHLEANYTRIIARLDMKGKNVVKGINLEGIRPVGNPNDLAKKYYTDGIDEIIYMDVVASLYGRNSLTKTIKYAATEIFVPLTVGGGIRNLSDIKKVLNSGADKVAINTEALKNPNFIKEAAEEVGSQAVVLSVEAKKQKNNYWEAYYDNGREKSGRDVLEWIEESVYLGAGEILITSVDNEGLKKGMDKDLLCSIREKISVPIIMSGGVGNINHIYNVIPEADGVAMASVLHYEELSVKQIKNKLKNMNILVR